MSKTAGTTSYTISTLFGGTATITSITYLFETYADSTSFADAPYNGTQSCSVIQTASAAVVVPASTSATNYKWIRFTGTVSINASGTFIPQYSLSAAPGGAYTVAAGSWMSIYPIGASGSNISVGTWA